MISLKESVIISLQYVLFLILKLQSKDSKKFNKVFIFDISENISDNMDVLDIRDSLDSHRIYAEQAHRNPFNKKKIQFIKPVDVIYLRYYSEFSYQLRNILAIAKIFFLIIYKCKR